MLGHTEFLELLIGHETLTQLTCPLSFSKFLTYDVKSILTDVFVSISVAM